MTTVLIIFSVVSCAAAITLGVFWWRLRGEEEARASARALALANGLSGTWPDAHNPFEPAPFEPADTDSRLDPLSQFAPESAATTSEDVRTRPPAMFASAGDIVDAPNGSPQLGSPRLGTFAIGAGLMIAAVLMLWLVGSLIGSLGARSSAPRTATAAAAQTAPLELLSLRQTHEGDQLVITGLVRNPQTNVRQERLTAVVFFFDTQGSFLSSARVPLDFRTLAPGDESPFRIALSSPANVGRYRVSFRHEEGAVVPHVDLRGEKASGT